MLEALWREYGDEGLAPVRQAPKFVVLQLMDKECMVVLGVWQKVVGPCLT